MPAGDGVGRWKMGANCVCDSSSGDGTEGFCGCSPVIPAKR